MQPFTMLMAAFLTDFTVIETDAFGIMVPHTLAWENTRV